MTGYTERAIRALDAAASLAMKRADHLRRKMRKHAIYGGYSHRRRGEVLVHYWEGDAWRTLRVTADRAVRLS